jgi:hypothetical protein
MLLAAQGNSEAIAAALSAGRKRHESKMVSARGLAAHLGALPAEAILLKLEAARDAMLASQDSQQRLLGSALRRQLRFLEGDGLDFGQPVLLNMLDLFAAQGILEAGEASALKSISEADAPKITEYDVRQALRGVN